MDLRSRLELYRKTIEKAPVAKVQNTARDIGILAPGKICANEQGSCYVIENSYPLSYRYGGCSLGDALQAGSGILAALGGTDCEGLGAGRLLYLDTETTGLSGAGTVAFLVGAGFFEGETFTVRQYFIRDYDEEEAMLTELQRLFDRHQGFVTFNGKAFDINLLQSRFISNRLKPSFRDLPNLDLLYPSRRIWGLKLESCRLASLEENVLGEYREDDIPGALIPSVYFKYLDDRDASDIKRVVRHNELDILSMVSLLARLSSMLQNPLSETDGGYELLGLGRIFEATGRTDTMLECFEACTGSDRHMVRSQAVKRLTGAYKKNGSYDLALEHWRRMESEDPGFEYFHLVEMAKYYEHKAKDMEFALKLVNKAMQKCLDAGLQHGKQYDDLRRRRERLMKKSRTAARESSL